MDLQPKDLVAAYGAVLATIAFGWNVLREWRERGRVTLNLYVADVLAVGSGRPREREARMLAGTVVNIGRRPIHLTAIEVQLKDGRASMIAPGTRPSAEYAMPAFPYELREDAQVSFRLPLELLGPDAVSIWARDTRGRKWRLPRKTFREVHKSAQADRRETKPPSD